MSYCKQHQARYPHTDDADDPLQGLHNKKKHGKQITVEVDMKASTVSKSAGTTYDDRFSCG
jgi:hypothetical protein